MMDKKIIEELYNEHMQIDDPEFQKLQNDVALWGGPRIMDKKK